jgi:spermidine synthase
MEHRVRADFRKWLAELFRGQDDASEGPAPRHRPPFIRRRWSTTELQFAHGVSQSRMLTSAPDKLLIDYTRTMLGALVLVPQPRSIGMVGLGGGSQAKFCHRHLPDARIEVVENNPQVLALRRDFHIPDDDARFRVVLDDGADFLRTRRGHYDLLLVDGYDENGIPEALSTQQFYDDCRAALTEGGAMAINLYCRDAQRHIDRLCLSFDRCHVMVLQEARQSNQVALAWVGQPAPEGLPMALPAAAQRELAAAFARVRAQRRRGTPP